MTYHNGIIVNNTLVKGYKYKSNIGEKYYNGIRLWASPLNNIPNKIRIELISLITTYVNKNINKFEITNDEIIKYFNDNYLIDNNEVFKLVNNINESRGATTNIIYELVKDKNDNLFGKELYTGELFPIYTKNNQFFNYKIIIEEKKVAYHYDINIVLEITPSIKVSSLLKCDYFIVNHKVADLNDVEKYKNQFNKKGIFQGYNKKEEKIFKKNIQKLANENVYKEDFALEDKKVEIKKELEKENIETILMEEIEYNLIHLKGINADLYIEFRNKYESLLNSFINKESLASLLGEIEFSLIFKKQGVEDILEVINNLKREYLDNFINKSDNKTDLNFKKLDKINELFLKVKNKYDYKSQRIVLNNLAFLYLMETLENIDLIDMCELNNSYFKIHLKSIIMWIKLLIECDILECSYIISIQDNINIEIVLDIIRNIKVKNIDEDKIKRIGELKWI